MTRCRVLLLIAIVTCLPRIARAETIGVDLLGAWIDPISSGNIRRLDATVSYSPRFRPQAGITFFFNHGFALSLSDTGGRIPANVTQDGAVSGRSSIWLDSRSAVLKSIHTMNRIDGYAGIGITRPVLHSFRPASSGSLTLIGASSPDHAAFIVNVGAAYRVTDRFRIVSDVKYEPFPSTAEVRRVQYPNDDLESNFHLLVVASGVSVRF